VWDFIVSKTEDMIAEGFKGRRQLPYAHWLTFLILRGHADPLPPQIQWELTNTVTVFPHYHLCQMVRTHVDLRAPMAAPAPRALAPAPTPRATSSSFSGSDRGHNSVVSAYRCFTYRSFHHHDSSFIARWALESDSIAASAPTTESAFPDPTAPGFSGCNLHKLWVDTSDHSASYEFYASDTHWVVLSEWHFSRIGVVVYFQWAHWFADTSTTACSNDLDNSYYYYGASVLLSGFIWAACLDYYTWGPSDSYRVYARHLHQSWAIGRHQDSTAGSSRVFRLT